MRDKGGQHALMYQRLLDEIERLTRIVDRIRADQHSKKESSK